jgi:acetylornithine deacetylase
MSDSQQLLADLVAIDSVNPGLVPGGAGEAEIAAYVAGWLRGKGLEVDVVEPEPGRPSVVAMARGTGGGRSLMLNAHMDTVGVDGMDKPFEPEVRDGRLYGRGSYDMKGALAACMLATARVAGDGLAGDVIFTGVADEEHASIGVQAVLERYTADAAIVTEPTALRVCVAHKGFVWAEIETRGRAAHGSRPAEGDDAIAKMGPVLTGLADLQRDLEASPGHPLLGPGSVHASLIEGGQEMSSYPARCVLGLERRTVPGETADDVRRECERMIEGIDIELRMGLVREPFDVDREADVVKAVEQAAEAVTGKRPEVYGDTPWMDAAFTQAAGIPTVVFGPGGGGAHAVEEWADLASVDACTDALVRAAHTICGEATT